MEGCQEPFAFVKVTHVMGARLIFGRAISERTLLFAAATTVLFANTVLAALAGYTGSVIQEGLRRTLTHPSFDVAGTRITGQVDPGRFPATDQNVRATMRHVFGDLPVA